MGAGLSRESFIWLMGSLCRMIRVPFDAALLEQRFPAPHDRRQFLEACRALDFRTGEAPIGKARFPCVGFLEGEPALLIKAERERLLYYRPGSTRPDASLAESFESTVILLRHESAEAESASAFGWRWFAAELLRHKRVWRDVLLASLFIQLVGFATPLGTQVVIDKVVVHHTTSTLAVIAAGLAMFLVFNAAMSWLRTYLVLHTGNRVDAVLGSQVLSRLLRLHLPYFSCRPTGTLVARIHAVETIREFMAGAAVSLVLDAPFLVLFLAVMFFYSWQLTLIALGILAAIVALSVLVTPVLRRRLNRQFLLGARNQAFLTEYVAGMETVKSLQMEPRLEARYDEYLAHYLAAGFSTRQLSSTYHVAVSALEQAMTLAILCAGALMVMRDEGFTIGMLVAFQMFAARLSQPMLRIAGLWQEFQQAAIAVQRLGDIMDAPAEPYAVTPSRAPEGRAEVCIAGLSFRYSPEHPPLYRDLSFTLAPGKLTVLTGPSGSGKSTLARLLLGFHQPVDGRITIDGRDIRHFSANELRQYFGVVPQETVLFSGTVYENLLAANPNASFGDVVNACRIAEVHDVVEKLPKGYHTEIGEHGAGLSGGQKQRIAIARAVLKRPRILIFDEATSSLDPPTAERFAHTVNKLKGAATILFVAHQLPRGLAVDALFSLDHER